MTPTRREFLRTGVSAAGALAASGGMGSFLGACSSDPTRPTFRPGPDPEVVVVGAGAFGGWTAYHLQRMGARVTLVDMLGPGNPRSTSGDWTRGIRSAYGDRELWTTWAQRAIERWNALNDQWAPHLDGPLFHRTGDLILRPGWDTFLDGTRLTFQRTGVPHEILTPAEVRARWPWIRTGDAEVALYEPGAGVGRAAAACRAVADALVREGGRQLQARALPGRAQGRLLREVQLQPGGVREAELFVFALGPWFGTALPDVMAPRTSIPMGHVFYFGPPPGDDRWTHPGMPSWNVPGVTGWPSLPSEPRGFRVRVGGRAGGNDPDATTREVPPEYEPAARAVLQDRFPDLATAPLLEARACHYDLTVSREWIVDRHPSWENAWIVGGGNAEGFKFGPVLGEYVAARILGDDPYPQLAGLLRL